jgi:hypothetical protein
MAQSKRNRGEENRKMVRSRLFVTHVVTPASPWRRFNVAVTTLRWL